MDWRRPAAIAVLLAAAGCAAAEKEPASITVSLVSDRNGRCLATVDGKTFDPNDQAAVEAALAPLPVKEGTARIVGDIDTPYRCIGGTIYTLQRNGFSKIGFISEPEPKDEAAEH